MQCMRGAAAARASPRPLAPPDAVVADSAASPTLPLPDVPDVTLDADDDAVVEAADDDDDADMLGGASQTVSKMRVKCNGT